VLELNSEEVEMEIVQDQNAKMAMSLIGGSRIELFQSTSLYGVIAKAIERKGEGVHHFAVRVKDINAAPHNPN
jgi:hypothetical protein